MNLTSKDIIVKKRQKNHTQYSQWESYSFIVKNHPDLFIRVIRREKYINDKTPMFRFWAYHCETLQQAKQYIADFINENGNAYNI